jgi:hypothetical protein
MAGHDPFEGLEFTMFPTTEAFIAEVMRRLDGLPANEAASALVGAWRRRWPVNAWVLAVETWIGLDDTIIADRDRLASQLQLWLAGVKDDSGCLVIALSLCWLRPSGRGEVASYRLLDAFVIGSDDTIIADRDRLVTQLQQRLAGTAPNLAAIVIHNLSLCWLRPSGRGEVASYRLLDAFVIGSDDTIIADRDRLATHLQLRLAAVTADIAAMLINQVSALWSGATGRGELATGRLLDAFVIGSDDTIIADRDRLVTQLQQRLAGVEANVAAKFIGHLSILWGRPNGRGDLASNRLLDAFVIGPDETIIADRDRLATHLQLRLAAVEANVAAIVIYSLSVFWLRPSGRGEVATTCLMEACLRLTDMIIDDHDHLARHLDGSGVLSSSVADLIGCQLFVLWGGSRRQAALRLVAAWFKAAPDEPHFWASGDVHARVSVSHAWARLLRANSLEPARRVAMASRASAKVREVFMAGPGDSATENVIVLAIAEGLYGFGELLVRERERLGLDPATPLLLFERVENIGLLSRAIAHARVAAELVAGPNTIPPGVDMAESFAQTAGADASGFGPMLSAIRERTPARFAAGNRASEHWGRFQSDVDGIDGARSSDLRSDPPNFPLPELNTSEDLAKLLRRNEVWIRFAALPEGKLAWWAATVSEDGGSVRVLREGSTARNAEVEMLRAVLRFDLECERVMWAEAVANGGFSRERLGNRWSVGRAMREQSAAENVFREWQRQRPMLYGLLQKSRYIRKDTQESRESRRWMREMVLEELKFMQDDPAALIEGLDSQSGRVPGPVATKAHACPIEPRQGWFARLFGGKTTRTGSGPRLDETRPQSSNGKSRTAIVGQLLDQALDRLVAAMAEHIDLTPLGNMPDIDWSNMDVLLQPDGPLTGMPIDLLPFGRSGRTMAEAVRSVSHGLSLTMRHYLESVSPPMGGPGRVLCASWLPEDDRRHMPEVMRLGIDLRRDLDGTDITIDVLTHEAQSRASKSRVSNLLGDAAHGYRLAVLAGHGDAEQYGIKLSGGLWQGEGTDLRDLDALILMACSVGRMDRTGVLFTDGMYANLAARSKVKRVVAASWPIGGRVAAQFTRELVKSWSGLLGRPDHEPGSFARSFHAVRLSWMMPGKGATRRPGDRWLAAAFAMYGLP